MLTVSLAVSSAVGLAALVAQPRRPLQAVAIACVVVVGATMVHHLQRTSRGQSAGVEWATAAVRAHTSRDSEVVSDLPIVPFLAHRRQPGALVDTSWTRLDSGWLTKAEIVRWIERSGAKSVVAANTFTVVPGLLRFLKSRFPVVVHRDFVNEGLNIRIYLPY